MGTSDASGIDVQLSQLVPSVAAAAGIVFPTLPANMKQSAPQFAAASFPTPSTMTPVLIAPPTYNNELPPMTPRTENQIAQILAQSQGGIISQSQQSVVAGLLANSTARHRMSQGMQEEGSNKRKEAPSDDDEEEQPVAPAPKKRKMDPLTIQVPKQTAPVQMQRLDQVVNAFVPPQQQYKPAVSMAPNPTPQLDTPNLTSLLSPTTDNSPLPTPTALIKNDIDGYSWPEAPTPKK